MKYEVRTYITQKGDIPFQEWFDGLKDTKAQTKVLTRLERVRFGNFGDFKSIKGTKGLFEMRERYGAGLRIYYSVIEGKVVLLLAGSIKRDQKKMITKAREYLEDYEKRTGHE
jgi:putative addiction module killer protein